MLTKTTGSVLLLAFNLLPPVFADNIPLIKSKPLTPAQAQMQTGLDSLNKGDLKAAENAFQESLRLQPDLVGSLAGMAEIALKKGDNSTAEAYLRKALNVAPSDPNVERSWARYLIAEKRLGDAEQALKKAVALAPKSAAVPEKELGDLYLLGMNKPAEALQAFRSAAALDPNLFEIHSALGSALAALGQKDSAEMEFREASRLAPADPMPPYLLGVLYLQTRDFVKAEASFDQAVKTRPDFIPAHMARAEAFEATNAAEKALAEYAECLKINPRYAPAQVKIGLIRQEQNRPAEANQAYLAAISLDPTQAIAYNNMAFQAAEQKANLGQALGWAQKAIELQPQAAQFQDTLGWVYRARGELDKASSTLLKASLEDPKDPVILYHLGVVYSEAHKNRDAAVAFNKALALKQPFREADNTRQRLARLANP